MTPLRRLVGRARRALGLLPAPPEDPSPVQAQAVGPAWTGPGASAREVARVRADIAAARALVEVNRRLGEPTRRDVAALAQVEPSSPQVAVIAAQRAGGSGEDGADR